MLKELKEEMLAKLRPHILGIVDSFGIPDKFLRSALITGNPYEVIMLLILELSQTRKRK